MRRTRILHAAPIGLLLLGLALPACHLFLEDDWGWDGAACNNKLQCQSDMECIGGWCRYEFENCTADGDCWALFGASASCDDSVCNYPGREFWLEPCQGDPGTCDGELDTCVWFPNAPSELQESEFCTYTCMSPTHCPPPTYCVRVEHQFVCAMTEFTAELGIMCEGHNDCPDATLPDQTAECIVVDYLDQGQTKQHHGFCSQTCSVDEGTTCPPEYACCQPAGTSKNYCVRSDLCP